MTKGEFMLQMVGSERAIRRSVVPLGIVYSLRIGSGFGVFYSAWLQWKVSGTDIQPATLVAICVCIIICVGTFPLERFSKGRFVRLALKCPTCQSCLVFLRNDSDAARTLETGCCYHCGKPVFHI